MSDRMVRRKKASISAEILRRLMTEGEIYPIVECIQGLPADSKFITAIYEPRYYDGEAIPGTFDLIFEHESFDPIPESARPPEISIHYKRLS